ncbi:SRPBCC family protein [Kineococcus sp. SYSU DK001]|uniref:SRPBCC family protein n=1 Tax=Kineococcus sp. SYSU DK001 TaxID=3383122 RepID=UPI003D7CCCC3
MAPRETVDFTATALVPGRVRHVFDVLTDWPRQTAWVPATVVARPDGGPFAAVGERFVATTTLGPFVLVDAMEVVSRVEPDPVTGVAGRVGVVKTGDVLGGDVEIVVAPAGSGLVRVEWTERIVVRPRWLARLAALGGPLPGFAGRTAFEAVLRAAADDLRGPS